MKKATQFKLKIVSLAISELTIVTGAIFWSHALLNNINNIGRGEGISLMINGIFFVIFGIILKMGAEFYFPISFKNTFHKLK